MSTMAPRGENRTKLLDAMRVLTLEKGFPATTVDEVCEQAQVSKGSFYHHFATKDEMAHAALDSYFDELVTALTNGPHQQSTDPVVRLQDFLGHAAIVCSGPLLTNGCMLGSFALDLSESHPDVRVKLADQFDVLAEFVGGLLTEAAEARGIDLPIEKLSRQFLAVIEGSIVLAKAHGDPSILGSGVDLFTDHVLLLLDAKGTS